MDHLRTKDAAYFKLIGCDRYELAKGGGNHAKCNYFHTPAAFGPSPNHTIGKHKAYFPGFIRASSKHIFLILKVLDHV